MARVPDWSEQEFGALLARPQATSAELREFLPQRSDDAITLVRNAIHKFHVEGTSPLLSQMMVRMLEAPTGSWRCPVCQQQLERDA